MPLQQQTQAFPLYGGVDTKTDAKYVPVTSTLASENVRFPANQQATKRYGQTALPSPSSAGSALANANGELLSYDGSTVRAFAQTQQAWVTRGSFAEVSVLRTPVIRTAGSVSGISTALTANAEVYAWEDSRGGVYWAARDPQSGTFLVVNTLLNATGTSPQVVVFGQNLYICYASGTSVFAAQVSPLSLSSGVTATFTLSASYSSGNLAVIAGTNLFLAWTSGAGTVTVLALNSNLAIVGLTTVAVTAQFLNWAFSTDQSCLGLLALTTAGRCSVFPVDSATGLAGAAATSAEVPSAGAYIVGCGTDASTLQVFYDNVPTLVQPAILSRPVVFSGATTCTLSALTSTTYGLSLASGVSLVGGLPYFVGISPLFNLATVPSQQTTFFLLRGTSPRMLLRFLGSSAHVGGNSLSVPMLLGSQLFLGLAERTSLRADQNGVVYSQTGLSAVYFTFPSVSAFKVVSFGPSTVVSCGNVYSYDGSALVESGFWQFPDGVTAAVSGIGSQAAGQYIYQFTYEWTDAAGNVALSAPSFPLVVQNAGAQGIALTIPYTSTTFKQGAVVCVYRTLVNTQGPLYKIFSTTNDPAFQGFASFVFTDTLADTDPAVSGQQFLYAPLDGSGERENDPPPPFLYVVGTKTRIFGLAEDDRTALWYSKPLTPGRPAEFSSAQILRIETDGGAVTALGALDDNCVVFKTARTYYVPGGGPNAAGQPANGFPPTPVLISSTSGCTNQASVLSTHSGVFFKSGTGIQVLNRSLSTDYNIGLPVQGLNSLTLTGAQIVPAQNQLRWTSAEGTALVFDYVLGRWSTYSNYAAVGYAPYGSTFARLTAGGTVFYEDTTLFTDDLQPVTMAVETCWFKSAGTAQGYAAVWYAEILGNFVSNHSLRIDVYYDYLPTIAQTAIWNAASNESLYGADSPYGTTTYYGGNTIQYTAPYQPRIALQRQVCEAIKFRITDVSQSGASCDLNEIALQLGVIGGLNRVPAGQQV